MLDVKVVVGSSKNTCDFKKFCDKTSVDLSLCGQIEEMVVHI